MRKIPLTRSKFAIIDDEDFDRVNKFKWHYVGNGTAAHRVYKGEYIYMHRLIMNTPPGLEVDHINHNKLDNRKSNLRNCTRGENSRNTRIRSDNTLGYKGIRFEKRNTKRKWVATIWVNGVNKFLGSYERKKDAVLAYNEGARKYHGKFAYLNKL